MDTQTPVFPDIAFKQLYLTQEIKDKMENFFRELNTVKLEILH